MYTKAIYENPGDHKLYSNRFSAYFKIREYSKALADAEKCTKLEPGWWKGWYRKGQAASALNNPGLATESYT